MLANINAFALESFTLANTETSYMVGAIIDLPANQLADLASVGLVREATEAEVSAFLMPAAPVADAPAAADPVPAPEPTPEPTPEPASDETHDGA